MNSDITKGIRLRKAVTNDRSAPAVAGAVAGTGAGAGAGAGAGRGSLGAPPVPRGRVVSAGNVGGASGPGESIGRRNSDASQGTGGLGGVQASPVLAGLFAGGMPKLKSRSGGVDTGGTVSRLL